MLFLGLNGCPNVASLAFVQDEDCNLHVFGLPIEEHTEILKPEGSGPACLKALDKAVEYASQQVCVGGTKGSYGMVGGLLFHLRNAF